MNFQDKIAKLCIDKYKSLKKTGKPRDNEWTVLAGVVLKDEGDNLKIVSLATGTKCLGYKELVNTNLYDMGSRLSDSHAEVLTRRAFIRYLYDQIDQLLSLNKSQVFIINDGSIEFKNGVSFHFYASHTPCGDCSIIPKEKIKMRVADNGIDDDDDGNPLPKILKLNDDAKADNGTIVENNSFVDDIHRTGAKIIATEEKQDLYLPGVNYHSTGPLRTKPGRGDRTLSLSCSDKMAKWNFVGIQGALLSLFIPVLKLETIVIGNGCPFSMEAMERGLCKRFTDEFTLPKIYQSSLIFMHGKDNCRINPCPSSIIWCATQKQDTEIAVEGRKQGATKNKKGNYLLVTRKNFLKTFLSLIEKHPNFKSIPRHLKKITYYDCKQWSNNYQKSWSNLRANIMRTWPSKPIQLKKFIL
ncbi:tRNA-specific adenosine deaminase 1 [Microplitis demolitor]|uniref:tRNA-specific adenosine deaminase 1 n=1 Tax=Microplitis demolitor TaxID=69319 RepID=UPI0004CD69A4|nr:tRNA-specific adenosine deaminase 1 [Microplitis demolitor]